MTQMLFEIAGIGRDRLHLAWVSSAEAQRFAEVVTAVTESIQSQGQFDAAALQLQLNAAETTLQGETLRWMVGKEVKITTQGDVYGRPWDQRSYESILDTVLEREYQVNLILESVKQGCQAPRDISAKTGLALQRVSYLLADMEKRSMVEFKGMDDKKPIFAAL
jgi:hypothetical protein